LTVPPGSDLVVMEGGGLMVRENVLLVWPPPASATVIVK
jgi:hypothetical protein